MVHSGLAVCGNSCGGVCAGGSAGAAGAGVAAGGACGSAGVRFWATRGGSETGAACDCSGAGGLDVATVELFESAGVSVLAGGLASACCGGCAPRSASCSSAVFRDFSSCFPSYHGTC